jgi:hypothetical protein
MMECFPTKETPVEILIEKAKRLYEETGDERYKICLVLFQKLKKLDISKVDPRLFSTLSEIAFILELLKPNNILIEAEVVPGTPRN